jgi:hypothetical protein
MVIFRSLNYRDFTEIWYGARALIELSKLETCQQLWLPVQVVMKLSDYILKIVRVVILVIFNVSVDIKRLIEKTNVPWLHITVHGKQK